MTLLPALKTEQRPSKHIIVEASIAQHKAQQTRNLQVAHAIQALMVEREDLLREVNSLRATCQPGPCVPRQAQPIDPVVLAMLAGRNEPATDPVTRFDQLPDLPLHLNIHETNLMPVSSGASVPKNRSHSHPLSHDNPSVSPPDGTDWTWSAQEKPPQATGLSTAVSQEVSLLWNQSPDPLTTTPPRDVDSRYDTNPTRLVDDAAQFWFQHPGVLMNTPPQHRDLPFSTNSPRLPSDPAMMWPTNPTVPTTKPINDAITMPHGVFESENPSPNHESLPL